MIKKFFDAAIVTIVPLAIISILGYLGNWFIHSHGEVVFGPAISIQDQVFYCIDINNYENITLDGIRFYIPKEVDINSIKASSFMSSKLLESTSQGDKRNIIVISGIQPDSMTRLFIPINNNAPSSMIDLINAAEMKLDIRYASQVKSSFRAAVRDAIVTAILYSILIFCSTLYINDRNGKRQIKYDNNINETKNDLKKEEEKWSKECDKIKEYNEKTRKDMQRSLAMVKVISLKRISYLQKENEYWRDTVRLYFHDKTGTLTDKIIMSIRKVLKIQPNYDDLPEYDLETLEEILKEVQATMPDDVKQIEVDKKS